MIESFGMLAYELAMESLLASVLFFIMARLSIRLFNVTSPTWRVHFLLMPILLPVAFVPPVHLIIRPLSVLPAFPQVEDLLNTIAGVSPLINTVFLTLAGLLLAVAVVRVSRLLLAAGFLELKWRYRCRSFSWVRCDNLLQSLTLRLKVSPIKLILTKGSCCGSLTLGPLGSYIVLPGVLATTLDDEEMEALLAHETGHIKRNDTLLSIIVGFCRSLLTFSPFAQMAYRELCRAREEAVDDMAVSITGNPLALASSLIKACRLFYQIDFNPAPTSGFLASWDAVERRILRLLDNPVPAEPSPWYPWAYSGVSVLNGALLLFTI